jgi:flagellar protein FliO/FliZ
VQPEFTALLWFGAIVALIPAVLWLLRRSPIGGRRGPGRAGTPRHVATLPLAPHSRLVTVEVGQGDERLWLVLGVTAHGIRTLHTMVPQVEEPATPPPPAAAFAQLLGRMRKGPDAN